MTNEEKQLDVAILFIQKHLNNIISRDTIVSRDKFTILYSIASRDGTVSIYANWRVASTRDYRISITVELMKF